MTGAQEAGRDPIDLFDALYTTPAVREFRPEPISPAVLQAIIDAAIRAPTGSNRQAWRFVAVLDPAVKADVGELYRSAWNEIHTPQEWEDMAREDPVLWKRVYGPANKLASEMGSVPAIVLVCLDEFTPRAGSHTAGASVYPAVQNLLLAARGFGIGGVLTTAHARREQELKSLLGIPDSAGIFALIPLGYPAHPFFRVRRRPVAEIAFLDSWGTPLRANDGT